VPHPREREVFASFVEKWVGVQGRPRRDATALVQAEKRLGHALPAAYRRFVAAHGAPSTHIGLLHSIVEAELDEFEVSEFIEPGEIVEVTTLYESGGMKRGFVGFASDGSGNLFLFRRSDCVANAEDAPVWLFDHDFLTIERKAPSFVKWLERLAAIESIPWK
jgi:hypothetical protein